MDNPLGLLPSKTTVHAEKYPLRSAPTMPDKSPVFLGIRWYTSFDKPSKDSQGVSWIGLGKDWGTVRGGHAVCGKQYLSVDPTPWWAFYNQGATSACGGFAGSRMMSHLNRVRYDAMNLYREAQAVDGYAGPHEGTTLEAVCDILRTTGIGVVSRNRTRQDDPDHGIVSNYWMTDGHDILQVLGMPSTKEYVEILNSWGTGYPHTVRMPIASVVRLLGEGGEATVVVDKPGP